MLSDSRCDPYERQACAEALGAIGNKEAIPSLTAALSDTDRDVRGEAAASLANLGDRRGVPILVDKLKSAGSFSYRFAAALMHLDQQEGFDFCLARLKNPHCGDDGAALYLGCTDNPRATEPLLALATDPRQITSTRCKAIEGLGFWNNPRSIAA